MTLRFRTFGSVYLTKDGEILTGAASQRRLLAILAVLSVVGDRGISRDKLLALLWSEGDPDRARHALTQSLYHIRKALGVGQLFVSGADIRLKPGIIESDVGQFQLALLNGHLETAAMEYSGPFLDGFYLNGEAEFDFWLSTERNRLSRQYADALRTLADSARRNANREDELRWFTALADHDLLDGAAAAQLMTSMIAAGDNAGALQRARLHEARMRSELDLPPDRAVIDLVTALRRDIPSPSGVTSIVPDDTEATLRSSEPGLTNAVAPPDEVTAAVPTETRQPLPRPYGHDDDGALRKKRRRRIQFWSAAVASLVGAALIGRSTVAHFATAGARRESRVMVAPFRFTSTDPSTAYLREGLLDLLTTRIGESDTKVAADPTVVLRAWRAAGYSADKPVSIPDARRIARQLDAGQMVLGSVESTAAGIVVHASLIDANNGKTRGTANVQGSADSLIVLTDRIIGQLILTEAGDRQGALPVTGTVSPAALRAFLTARSAYRRADYFGAVRANEQALMHDPKFALAAFNLAIAADRANVAEQHDRGLAIAWANQASLSPQDRAYLRAFAGPRYPEPSSASEVLAAWEHVVRVAPDRAEGWHALGESFYYDGEVLGMRDGPARAGDAFRHALAIDPKFAPARRMLTLLLARQGDTVALRQLLLAGAPRDTADAMSVFVRWRAANALGNRRELARVRRAFDGASNGALRAIAMTSQFDGVSIDDGDRALEILRRRPLTDGELLDVGLARHSRALNSGDYAEAAVIVGEIGARQPSLHTQHRLRVLDALYSGGDRDSARASAAALDRFVAGSALMSHADSAVRLADACVAGQWRLSLNDTSGARAAWHVLHDGGSSRFPVPIGANPATCAELLDALLAVAERGAGARDRLAHMDSLMLSGPAVGDAMRYANLALARRYRAIGDPTSAVNALKRRSYMRGWPRYRATGLQLTYDLALQLGDTAAARSAYERLRATRRQPAADGAVPVISRIRSFSHHMLH